MAKQRKIMDVCEDGCHLEVIRIYDRKEANPYRIRKVAGGHHNQIASYGDFMSVLHFLLAFYEAGMNTCTLTQIKQWWKESFV